MVLYIGTLLVKGYNEVVFRLMDGELICSKQRLTRILKKFHRNLSVLVIERGLGYPLRGFCKSSGSATWPW
jgi:hypothetical protein